jgi:hypothetical protein
MLHICLWKNSQVLVQKTVFQNNNCAALVVSQKRNMRPLQCLKKRNVQHLPYSNRDVCNICCISKEKCAALVTSQKRNVQHWPYLKREIFNTRQISTASDAALAVSQKEICCTGRISNEKYATLKRFQNRIVNSLII